MAREDRPHVVSSPVTSIETVFYDADGCATGDPSRAVRADVYAVDTHGSRVGRLSGLEWKVDRAALLGDEGELATRPYRDSP